MIVVFVVVLAIHNLFNWSCSLSRALSIGVCFGLAFNLVLFVLFERCRIATKEALHNYLTKWRLLKLCRLIILVVFIHSQIFYVGREEVNKDFTNSVQVIGNTDLISFLSHNHMMLPKAFKLTINTMYDVTLAASDRDVCKMSRIRDSAETILSEIEWSLCVTKTCVYTLMTTYFIPGLYSLIRGITTRVKTRKGGNGMYARE